MKKIFKSVFTADDINLFVIPFIGLIVLPLIFDTFLDEYYIIKYKDKAIEYTAFFIGFFGLIAFLFQLFSYIILDTIERLIKVISKIFNKEINKKLYKPQTKIGPKPGFLLFAYGYFIHSVYINTELFDLIATLSIIILPISYYLNIRQRKSNNDLIDLVKENERRLNDLYDTKLVQQITKQNSK